jgi:hypothetical protein
MEINWFRKDPNARRLIILKKTFPNIISNVEVPHLYHRMRYDSLEKKISELKPFVYDEEMHELLLQCLITYLRRPSIRHSETLEVNRAERYRFEFELKHSQDARDLPLYEVYIENRLRFEHIAEAARVARLYAGNRIKSLLEQQKNAQEKIAEELVRRRLKLSPTDDLDDFGKRQLENTAERFMREVELDGVFSAERDLLPSKMKEARDKFNQVFNVISQENFELLGSEEKNQIADHLQIYIEKVLLWYYQSEYPKAVLAQEEKIPIVKKKVTPLFA